MVVKNKIPQSKDNCHYSGVLFLLVEEIIENCVKAV